MLAQVRALLAMAVASTSGASTVPLVTIAAEVQPAPIDACPVCGAMMELTLVRLLTRRSLP